MVGWPGGQVVVHSHFHEEVEPVCIKFDHSIYFGYDLDPPWVFSIKLSKKASLALKWRNDRQQTSARAQTWEWTNHQVRIC